MNQPPHHEPTPDAEDAIDSDDVVDPEALVTLTKQPTEFRANIIVVTLRDAGIESRAFGTGTSWLGLRLSPGIRGLSGVPVQVRRKDLQQAREVLNARLRESGDIDWNEVDVGAGENDDSDSTTPARMPLVAQLGFGVIVAILILSVIGLVMMMIYP